MSDENNPQFNNGITPPPLQDIGVRTMQSDLKSTQESGGETPQSYTPPSFQSQQPAPATEPSPSAPQPQLNASGYTGPEEPIFPQPNEPLFTSSASDNVQPPSHPKSGGALKITLWIISILIIAAGLGLFGYFVVFPLVFSGKPEIPPTAITEPLIQQPPVEPTPPAPPSQPPAPEIPIPEIPIAPIEPILPATSTEQQETSTSTENKTLQPISPQHQSFFKTTTTLISIPLESLSVEPLRTALLTASKTFQEKEFREFIIEKSDKIPVTAYQLFIALINSELKPEDITMFEDDFTSFIWTNNQGSWPGYILKIKSSSTSTSSASSASSTSSIAEIQTQINQWEQSFNYKNLFIADPGAIQQPFKDGKIEEIKTRYQVYALPGAALNYVLFNNYFILSGSYSGLVEALKNL